ncbi:MAG: hypothetical protein P0S96_02755 [Simkaniaceae bacterium]|nr:hypothetical protein [Candidatus Sacchlamyda saccharinae]
MSRFLKCFLFIPLFLHATVLDVNEERIKRSPEIYLNPQDVPLFYVGNPLNGLDVFSIIPPYTIQTPEVNRQIEQLIVKELGSVGSVVKASDENLAGFGSGNLMNIQIGKVAKWNGGDLPITRVTLSIETAVTICKTNDKSNPRVWSINDYVDAPLEIGLEKETLGAVQKLLREFVRNYKFANQSNSQKPTFYLHSQKS